MDILTVGLLYNDVTWQVSNYFCVYVKTTNVKSLTRGLYRGKKKEKGRPLSP